MSHNFLRSLEHTKSRNLPSIRFEEGLSEWGDLRSRELVGPIRDNYTYYVDALSGVFLGSLRNHDRMINLEMQPEDEHDEYRAFWSFDALGDYPARVLSSIAYHLGWRLVPYARWVSVRVGDQSLGFYVEQHCRQWAEEADTVFRLLQRKKINQRNAASQRALIGPIRTRADMLIRETVAELSRLSAAVPF